jgi:Gas vesicle synthesis protein GvpO
MAAERARDERPATGGDPGAGDSRIAARDAAQVAVDYMEEMTGEPPEVVIAAESADSGWLVTVEVLELARVPDSTDVLASYEVELDAGGEPRAYRRIRRYHRAWVGEE